MTVHVGGVAWGAGAIERAVHFIETALQLDPGRVGLWAKRLRTLNDAAARKSPAVDPTDPALAAKRQWNVAVYRHANQPVPGNETVQQ
jgi:hypothetical protein